jgi:putative transcriptional regulator
MKKKDFEGIMQGLAEATAFARGEDVPGIRVHIPAEINTKAIRKRLGMTQAEFAGRHGFSVGAVRDWEQGRRMPDSGTRAFLKVIAMEPAVVGRVLETA